MMGHVTGAGWDLGEFSPGLGCSVGVGLMLHPRASASTKSAATALMQALYDAGLVLTPKPQWMLCEDRQPGPGETMLKPSTVDSIIIDIESHP